MNKLLRVCAALLLGACLVAAQGTIQGSGCSVDANCTEKATGFYCVDNLDDEKVATCQPALGLGYKCTRDEVCNSTMCRDVSSLASIQNPTPNCNGTTVNCVCVTGNLPNQKREDEEKGISGAAIAGIVVACVVAAGVALGGFIVYRRWQAKMQIKKHGVRLNDQHEDSHGSTLGAHSHSVTA
eukprot:comp17087_c0_seq2/m.15840 comp17087_c0_seq2/g.15840  ORF comp17087_c0_seq2/g.15840 comp17087_c0_seq2/m.15840 type:complete len:183 (-) comp17087_c0_seq2:432-980(-)